MYNEILIIFFIGDRVVWWGEELCDGFKILL